MLRSVCLLALFALAATSRLHASEVDRLVRAGLVAESELDSRRALEFFLSADQAKPNDSVVLQKIAQQYSDLVVELTEAGSKKSHAETALAYAQRAVTLDPESAVNVLSLAVCHGKLAACSNVRTKLEYSRLVKEEAERAIALDPNYAWAHHVLGRWNCEVAALSGTTKFLVRLIYGEIPAASTAQGVAKLSRAVELEPDELAHRLELGFALQADGQPTNARVEWEKGLAMPSRKKHDEAAKTRVRVVLKQLNRQ